MNIIKKLFLRIRAEIVYAKAKAVADRKAGQYPPLTFFVLPMESGKLIVVNYDQYVVSVSAMLVYTCQKNIAQAFILERYFFVSICPAAIPGTCLSVFLAAVLPLC